MKPLVSIITPCFNAESYLRRWAESILLQTYRPLELIFVDDGSTDGSAEVFRSYVDRFESDQIATRYIYQKNAGIGAAMNRGLSIFRGDYLIWFDSDDYLLPDSISLRVDYLERHRECGLVRSDGVKTNEADPFVPLGSVSRKRLNRFRGRIFEDILMSRTFPSPGSYMVRASAFYTTFATRNIYPYKYGHNDQLLLPITFRYKCGYIDRHLWVYVNRANSVTRVTTGNTLETRLGRIGMMEGVLKHVLDEMGEHAEGYRDWVTLKYLRQRLELSCCYHDKALGFSTYSAICKLKKPGLVTRLWYFGSQHPLYASCLLRLDALLLRVSRIVDMLITRVVCGVMGDTDAMGLCERRMLNE